MLGTPPGNLRLYRVVPSPRYLTRENDRERPTSDCLKESNYENSCFVEGELSPDEVYAWFHVALCFGRGPEFKIARHASPCFATITGLQKKTRSTMQTGLFRSSPNHWGAADLP